MTNSGDKIELYRHVHAAPDSEQTPGNESPPEIIKFQTQGLWHNSIQMDHDRHWLLDQQRSKSFEPEEIHIWDIAAPDPKTTERVAARITREEKHLPQTEFSPDGRWLLLQRMKQPISKGKTVLFLGAAMETLPTEMEGGERAMRLIDLHSAADAEPRIVAAEQSIITTAFSPDGHWLATGHEDFSVRLWDLRSEGPEFQSWDLGRRIRKVSSQYSLPKAATGIIYMSVDVCGK